MRSEQRPILLSAVRGLVATARELRGRLSATDPARHFYLGVEAAGDEVLHPELLVTRAEGWLDREPPAFRDGYVKTSILLADAMVSDTPPLHIVVPEPDRSV
jgi:hypothetical protein